MKVKVVLAQWRILLEKDLMLIKDVVKQQEVEVEEENLKSFASDVECQFIGHLNVHNLDGRQQEGRRHLVETKPTVATNEVVVLRS